MWRVEYPFKTIEICQAFGLSREVMNEYIKYGELKGSIYCSNGIRKLSGYHSFFDAFEFLWASLLKKDAFSENQFTDELLNVLAIIDDSSFSMITAEYGNAKEIYNTTVSSLSQELGSEICAESMIREADELWQCHRWATKRFLPFVKI